MLQARTARASILERQHLIHRLSSEDWRQVPISLIGIHAARVRSPIFSLAARVDITSLNKQHLEVCGGLELTKVRCMRGTLHIVDVKDAAVLHYATWRQRRSVCERLSKLCGLDELTRARVSDFILDMVQGVALSSTEIESRASVRSMTTAHVRAALKYLWEAGDICYVNASTKWECEKRQYTATSARQGAGGWRPLADAEAERLLFGRYFAAYGPATVADAAWWSGLSAGRVKRAVASLNELVTVSVLGEAGTHYMRTCDLERSESKPTGSEPVVRFLAHEDNLLKGYMPSRSRFVNPAFFEAVFNVIGEARATIAIDGEIVGLWTCDISTRRISTKLFRKLERNEQLALTLEADRLNSLVASS